MIHTLVINVIPGETRIAAFDKHHHAQGIWHDQERTELCVGDVYKAKVSRVLPGIQAAFVDIGQNQAGFLHVSDTLAAQNGCATADIRDHLSAGQILLVQVAKAPWGNKGPRLTMQIAIPSRFVVYLPYGQGIQISNKLSGSDMALRWASPRTSPEIPPGGYIIRTNAQHQTEAPILHDMQACHALWQAAVVHSTSQPVGALIHREHALTFLVIRDALTRDLADIIVDCEQVTQSIVAFLKQFAPEYANRVSYRASCDVVYDRYGIDQIIHKHLQPRVHLPSGGSIVIEQTEAMVAIDVNSGRYMDKKALASTIMKTNLEAVDAIAHAIKLRNLSGIIVVDFIDMATADEQTAVLDRMRVQTASDYVKVSLGTFSALGLLEMTRKRIRPSLAHMLCSPCTPCTGTGRQRTHHAHANDVLRRIKKLTHQQHINTLRVVAHPLLTAELTNGRALSQLIQQSGCQVDCVADAGHDIHHYTIHTS